MTTLTPKLGMVLMPDNPASPDVIVNQSLILVDAILGGVADGFANTPPGSPTEGMVYLIDTAPTGSFVGFHMAVYFGGGWIGFTVPEGKPVYNTADGCTYQKASSGWVKCPMQITVSSATTTTPPSSPLPGDRYIVGPSSTGDWAGQDGKVATYRTGGWIFFVPQAGWIAYVVDTATLVVYDGSAWGGLGGSGGSLGGSGGSIPIAGPSTLGGVKIGANVSVALDGKISVAAPFSGNYDDLSGTPTSALSYNATTKILTFVDETGASHNLDISGLKVDLSSGSSSYSSTTGVLTLTETDGNIVTINLSSLKAVNSTNSIQGDGDTTSLKLVGDTASPGNYKIYSTEGTGTKGWQDLATSISALVSSALGSLGLATVAKTGQYSDLSGAPAASGLSQPQGRVTLSTGVPVMTSTVSGATAALYTPFIGQYVPLYNGTTWSMADTGGELTAALTDNTKSPAAAANNSIYDLFVWDDSGTKRLSRGPAWSSDTSRGTGSGTTELTRLNGIRVNKFAITNGPAANKGTYVGSIRTNGSATIDFSVGGIAAKGTAANLSVWNQYHRADISVHVGDSTSLWSYNTATVRPLNNSSTMRCSFLCGEAIDAYRAEVIQDISVSSGGGQPVIGVGYDSTTAFSGISTHVSAFNNSVLVGRHSKTDLGYHYFQALEKAIAGAAGYSATGQNVNIQNGLVVHCKY